MTYAEALSAASSLPFDERIRLVQEVWDSIAESESVPVLLPKEEAELDRRLAHLDEHSGDVVPWEVVRQEARDRNSK